MIMIMIMIVKFRFEAEKPVCLFNYIHTIIHKQLCNIATLGTITSYKHVNYAGELILSILFNKFHFMTSSNCL